MEQPLYQRLADHYRQAIYSGVLAPTSRMPSVRTMVRLHQVSISTALQACRSLEDDGLIEARPRSGYFVLKTKRSKLLPADEPDTRQVLDAASYVGIHDRVSDFIAKSAIHPPRVDLASSVAPADAYPVDALKQAMLRSVRRYPDLLTSPAPHQGHPVLRATLARRALDAGINATPDDIIVTHGCIEALNLALRAVAGPGDTIAVESPAYFGLLQVIGSLGMRALEIPTSPQRGLSIEALDLAFQTHPDIKAVVVVPNLHNPLGSIMPDEDKARLVALCERQAIPLIEDDTYGPLADGDEPLRAAKAWDRDGNVIYCASMQKTLAPGSRLGWMIGGRWKARLAMLKYVQSRPNGATPQVAVAEVLQSKGYDRHLMRLRRRLRTQREGMARAIAEHFPRGTRLSVPRGGMLLWVELPDGRASKDVFETALAAGIRVAPGRMFSNTDRYDHFLRVSCAHPMSPEVHAAVRTLGRIVAGKH
ncbi:2-aminoadipate aminotransferase [Bordetella genomosp. 9]|uniref:aminotransferase-like domain-containing protein n=1 Tax=Bordetella genomosp. 9 TaxID=1416803 RepID=UPI000A292779|nr:PLP-dependent aminotransferase family protein [Bordetella genomosp. 9]ARP91154.1 2-aminoadipate aminotransferase [Bordetella genomosp. 9]